MLFRLSWKESPKGEMEIWGDRDSILAVYTALKVHSFAEGFICMDEEGEPISLEDGLIPKLLSYSYK